MSTSKTGKNGSARVNLVGFTGKKYEDISPSTHKMDVPVDNSNKYTLINIDDGLMNTDGATKVEVKLPDGELGEKLQADFNDG